MSVASGPPRIDELLDRAFQAINEGDRATAKVLAEQVLELDEGNADAEDLLAAPIDHGEIRRLTIMFADLVDSTALSTRTEPEIYRTVVGRYRDDVLGIVGRYEGHIMSTKGDGLLALFGHPHAHEDDVRRAVQAGLDITRAVTDLSERVQRRYGFGVDVRVGIHRGMVYLETAQDDVYGLAANLAARVCGIAEPGSVAVTEAVERLVRGRFELEPRPPTSVKGVDAPLCHFRVTAEHDARPALLSPLVSRSRELSYMEQSWLAATDGRLRTPGVLFKGDAGIGKSRLAWTAVAMAERSNAVVLQLIGSPFHTDVGLRPVRRLLERRCGITRATEPSERLRSLIGEVESCGLDRTSTIPLLAPICGIEPRTGYEPVAVEGRRLFDLISGAVHRYLRACVHDRLALVLAEDLHWFDEDTLEVVGSLLTSETGGQLMVLMTSRNNVPLPEGAPVEVFELAPLSVEDSERLITALYPAVTEAEKHAIRRRCDGVPLYIEEVVAKLRDQPSDSSSTAGVPDTLYEALFVRLRSSENSVRVAEAAAIIGNRVERSLLISAVDLQEVEVDHALTQLIGSRVLEPLETDTWRFRHDLLREVAAELSPPTLRRELHSRIADSLLAAAAEGNPDWPLIAHHCGHAQRYGEAAMAYGHTSANAAQRGALGEARNYLTHAIENTGRAAPGPHRNRTEIAFRLRRALLAQAAEGVASVTAAEDFENCLQLCSNDLQDDDLFSTLMSLYPYYTMRADLERAERLVRSIRASLTGSRQRFLPINEFALGMLAWYRGEFAYARTKLHQAEHNLTEDAARELADMLFMPNDPAAGLYTHRALMCCIDGDLPGAEAELKSARQRCARVAFPQGAFSHAYTLQIEVLIRLEAGQFTRAGTVADHLAGLGEQHGFDSWVLAGTAQRATADAAFALARFDGDAATLQPHIATLTAFVDAWRMLGVISLLTFYDALLARLLTSAGELTGARERIQIALDLADETGMHFYDAELHRLRARTTDDAGERHADLVAATELASRQHAQVFELRAALDRFATESDRQVLAGAVELFPTHCAWPEVTRARKLLG